MSAPDIPPSLTGIAIVGMSGRFPGARNLAEFWHNLRAGVESITVFSDEELMAAGVDAALLRDPNYIKARGVLQDVDRFDAGFFDVNPREADITDPQQRIFLECAWEALEHAGYDPASVPGSAGVFAGSTTSGYYSSQYVTPATADPADAYHIYIGNDKDHLATRTAYKFNLKGPCITVQTACSTSLVAVALACESLLHYRCDLALAGGVCVLLPQQAGYLYQEGGIQSPDGHCRAFDASAQGMVVGGGVGIVVLKRLADAVADGDCIHAVIKGSAINNDGSVKVGFTAPSIDGQADVIALAQAVAHVHPDTITFVEAHGTGTSLGDPVEVAALTQAFRLFTERTQFCAIGSVKTNIGHLDTAAGIAGLIKTVLALEHREIPPSLHFHRPNPEIDFAASPFYVNASLAPWPAGATPRRAGVSSFGIGGTNAHVIVEEAPSPPAGDPPKPSHLLVLSAKTAAALERATSNLLDHLKQHPELPIADVAYTLHVGRRSFAHRRMVLCDDVAGAIAALETLDPHHVFTDVAANGTRPVAFMFPGQGAQYAGMGRDLYAYAPVFREHVDRCAELLTPHLGLDVRQALYPSEDGAGMVAHDLDQTALTQPALFVIEYALAQLWISCGVQPEATIGHSVGEYVAACLSGVLSLEDALALVAARGRLMQQQPVGAMLAVSLSEPALQPLLGADLSLAAVNSPSLCVVAGPHEAVARLQRQLTDSGIASTRLRTSHAFHSMMMEPTLEPFAALVRGVALLPPQRPYLSNVTGTWATDAVTDPAYWAEHMRQTVRFADGMGELLQEPERVLLEVGPGDTLGRLAQRHPLYRDGQMTRGSLRRPRNRVSDLAYFLMALGRLWLSGVPVAWSGLYTAERRRRLPLPTYAFERERHWIGGVRRQGASAAATSGLHKGPDVGDWFYVPSWRRAPAAGDVPQGPSASDQAPWLVFSDAHGLGTQVIDRLTRDGAPVTAVLAGDAYRRDDATRYVIDPRRPVDYQTLLWDLQTQRRLPGTIVHLWGVTPEASAARAASAAQATADDAFHSLLFLAQALGDQTLPAPVRLDVVTNAVHAVTREEAVSPLKAILLGPIKVIPQEYPTIRCRNVDVVFPPPTGSVQARWLSELVAELRLASTETIVAYRGGSRWLQTVEPIRLDRALAGTPKLRTGGVYLITGGLGGIGLTLAEHLARSVRAKLVLLGRTGLPDREGWDDWVAAHGADDAVSQRISRVRSLEALGAEVVVQRADVRDPSATAEAVHATLARFGAIHGVIHAAGTAGGGVIQLKTPEAAASVLAPKVQGTLALAAALRDVPLDFLVLCSSINAIIGGAGLSDYCAANAFLDAYAHQASQSDGRFVVSINWDTWREVGMAVDAVVPIGLEALKAASLREGISSSEGIDVFQRILATSLPQVIVSTRDLPGRLAIERAETLVTPDEALASAAPAPPKHARPPRDATYVAPRTEMERLIAELWQDLLGIEQVGIDDDFFQLGGHSLLAIQFSSRLRAARHVKLSLHMLFESPTVARLAACLDSSEQPVEAPSDDEVVRLLGFVEQLSDDAIKALLSEPTGRE